MFLEIYFLFNFLGFSIIFLEFNKNINRAAEIVEIVGLPVGLDLSQLVGLTIV